MEYTAEDYINFIEQGRMDKISPHALDIIAKRFRDLQQNKQSEQLEYKRVVKGDYCGVCGSREFFNDEEE